MLGIPLRYVLKHFLSAAADLAADPFEVLMTVREYIAEEREPRRPQYPYQHDDDWERRLHEHIGVSLRTWRARSELTGQRCIAVRRGKSCQKIQPPTFRRTASAGAGWT
jgi:hypothetical protein